MSEKSKQGLTARQQEDLLRTLKTRFEKHTHRHAGINWADVEARLIAQPDKLYSLHLMEETGGQPDVARLSEGQTDILFVDCAPETPLGRRSLCYDEKALASRKENKPAHSALGLAAEMGIEVLDEAQYRALQRLEAVDLKSSSWILTPEAIRKLGGALFCDRRYDTVFVYHNGAESYYSGRAFRGFITLS